MVVVGFGGGWFWGWLVLGVVGFGGELAEEGRGPMSKELREAA